MAPLTKTAQPFPESDSPQRGLIHLRGLSLQPTSNPLAVRRRTIHFRSQVHSILFLAPSGWLEKIRGQVETKGLDCLSEFGSDSRRRKNSDYPSIR